MKPKLTVEVRSDPNGGHTAVIMPYLTRNEAHRTKRYASQPGAVEAAKVWAADCAPNHVLQFVFVTEV